MFNLGIVELIVLGVIALLVVGPKQLPEVARTVARFLNQLRSATREITDSFSNTEQDLKEHLLKVTKELPSGSDVVSKYVGIEKETAQLEKALQESKKQKENDRGGNGSTE